jgi:glycosyltransferase involved in cell wall biosynthesis
LTNVALYPGPIDTPAIRRYTEELSDGLTARGADVRVCRSEGANRTLIGYFVDLWRVRGKGADLNIICSEGLSYLLLALPASRTLVVCHDVHPILETRMMPRSETMTLQKRLFRVKYRSSLRVLKAMRRARIVAITEHTANHLVAETEIPRSRVSVIHNGLTEAWSDRPSPEAQERVAELTGERLVVLHVGNDNWYKNFSSVVEAVALLHRQDVLLVKAGHLSDASRRQIDRLGLTDRFVYLHGPTDDELRALYRRASMLVFPSWHEGFGWPPLEAMAAGCPTIVSSTGSLPEVCAEAAEYVDPASMTSIVAALERVLSDAALRDRLSSRGRQRSEEFSWEQSAAAFLALGSSST